MGQDLAGRRFGMLVALEETEPVKDSRGHPVRRYRCLCDCGNEKVFRYNNLLSGITNSCGCTRFPKQPPADLTGKRFGSLTVISEAEKHIRKGGGKLRRWNCLCDCGNETTVLHNNLTSPHGIRRCRHCGKQGAGRNRRNKNLAGNRYGRLTVLSEAEPGLKKNGTRIYRWLCRCDCGQEKEVEEWNLFSGHTRSCGCLGPRDVLGKKFGMLTVVSKAPESRGMRYWNCLCGCGNGTVVSWDDLFWESVTDCGCRKQGKNQLDLAGQRFGRLTAIREVRPFNSPKGTHERAWLCRCDCGREVVVRQRNLKNRVTRSCGCLRKDKANKARQKVEKA